MYTFSGQPSSENPFDILELRSWQLLCRMPQLPRKTPGASAIMCEMIVGLRRSISTSVKNVPPLTSSPQYFRS